MKKSEINFNINLDDQNVPESIDWSATDKPGDANSSSNAIAISVWDQDNGNTLRMDLWTKEMTTDEMKRFTVDSIGGLAESVKSATGDDYMSDEIHALCRKLVKHIEEERKKNTGQA